MVVFFFANSSSVNLTGTYLLPMPLLETRITNGLQDRDILSELFHFSSHHFRNSFRSGNVIERLCQLIKDPPDILHFFPYLIRVQTQKRTYGSVQLYIYILEIFMLNV